MSVHRDQLILAAVQDAGLHFEFAAALQAECPWLDGAAEVNESFGPDLLAEQATVANLSRGQVARFLHVYNARVRALTNPFEGLQSEAYAEVCTALVGQGRADAFGEGDYWVNEDSFSTRWPTIVVFGGFRFSENAVRALRSIVSSYASAFNEMRISSEEGAEVLTMRAE
ncbi:hypothetical protein [Piscinibacter sp. XHJ-5]|uniref:hypothetical protein n=1 Tax=Piscinibacter sp. XHJ-5 TaxID=3037797 RepID=UPI00245326C1|nr:hypothetical protein [Piscinibacter sp. XHJ-5]